MIMLFIETPIFTEDVLAVLNDDEYRKFQQYLADNSLIGDVIPDTGACEKSAGQPEAKERVVVIDGR